MSTEQLEAKVVALRAEVADRVALVASTKATRDADLARREDDIIAAEAVVSGIEDLVVELEYEALSLRREADDIDENIAAIPEDSLRGLAVAKAAKECAEEHWRNELAKVQDGKLRRKLAELERLEKRLEARTLAPRVRGTGRPEVENAKRSVAKQYKLTLKQYAEVQARHLFQHPRYKGPPEWAFLKAIDDLEKQLSIEERETIRATVKADMEVDRVKEAR